MLDHARGRFLEPGPSREPHAGFRIARLTDALGVGSSRLDQGYGLVRFRDGGARMDQSASESGRDIPNVTSSGRYDGDLGAERHAGTPRASVVDGGMLSLWG